MANENVKKPHNLYLLKWGERVKLFEILKSKYAASVAVQPIDEDEEGEGGGRLWDDIEAV